MYVFELFDTYAASGMALLWFACFECLCIGWFYGADRFYDDIQRMIGYRISPWMKYAWQYTGPIFTMVRRAELVVTKLSSEILLLSF